MGWLVKGSSGMKGTMGMDLLDVITITGTLIIEEQTFITESPMSPLEVAFRQFAIHFVHLDHQELELWPRSVASHFYGLIQIIIFAFLSFRKMGSLVLVEALA